MNKRVVKALHRKKPQPVIKVSETLKDGSFKIELDRIPVTLNRFLRLHWATRIQDKSEWKQYLLPYYKIRNAVSGKKIELTITVYRSRLQDPDNKVGSVKNLVDALKEMGFLVDDNNEYLILKVEEKKVNIITDSQPARTVLELKVIEDLQKEGI